MATDNELEGLFGKAPNDLGVKIQQSLQDAWKKEVLREREENFVFPTFFWRHFSLFCIFYLFVSSILVLVILPSGFSSPFFLFFSAVNFGVAWSFATATDETPYSFISIEKRKKTKIINSQPITTLPTPEFIFDFAQSRGVSIIESHIQTFQDNVSKLRKHKDKLQSDLREAQRLYAGDMEDPIFLTMQKTLHSKMAKIDQEVERVQPFIERLEDFKDEVYRRIKMIVTKEEQLELFKKVMKDNTEEMVVKMKTKQQLAVQELEESFTVLLSMMNDAQHYIDAKQEVEHKMLD